MISIPAGARVVEVEPGVQSVFTVDLSTWDYEAELESRSKDKPYILHYDEFFNCEEDYDQSALTYYQTDDILTDENDVPVFDFHNVVGDLRFGHGSNDPNVVYIRNDRLKAEYEVLLNSGSYQEEILGQKFEKEAKDELKHSTYKFRLE